MESKPTLLHLLHRVSQIATDRFSQLPDSGNLTVRQVIVMRAIAESTNSNQTDITSVTGVDRSTLADIVRRLVKRNLVSRRRTKEDARAYALRLTDDGRQALDRATSLLAMVEAHLLERLTVSRRRELVGALEELAAEGKHRRSN